MTKLKYCPNCGSKIKKLKVDFCPFCGEQVGKKLEETHIVMILDRSGSMSSIKESTIASFNNFIQEQRKLPYPATVSLYQFDDRFETVYENMDLKEVPFLNDDTYQPRASTALYDAIGKTISRLEKGKRVLISIITDGQENASREYNDSQIHNMITDYREKYNWQFAFLGVGIDAYKASSKIGIGKAQTMRVSHNAEQVAVGISMFSGGATSYRKGKGEFTY